MNVVILGIGGMGAISLSKIVAQTAINKKMPIRSTEIHGMAKKGGLVEIHLKVGNDLSPYIIFGQSDFAIVLDKKYLDYAKAFLRNEQKGLIVLKDEFKISIMEIFGDIRFANSFILGLFIKEQNLFSDIDIIDVLKNFKEPKKNIEAFKKGLLYDF